MGLLDWISRRPSETKLASLAEIVAEQCRESVWQRVARRAGTLQSLPEAQGYVRTRGGVLVRQKAAHLVRMQDAIPAAAEQKIVERATSLVAGQLVTHLLQPQPVYVTDRRAA